MTIPLSASRLHLACAAIAALVLHSCSPEPAYAATPLQLRWTAELSDPKPYQAVLFQGETADLQATLKLYGRPVALEAGSTASLWWQTNGMGAAWWQSAATGTTADGPFSVGGTITSTFAEPEQLTLVLFRKLGITTDSAGNVREGFGGLPAAIQTVLSDAGSFTIRGIEPGYYVLLATVAGTGWQDGFWHSFPDGRPKTIHVTGSITNADIVVG